jgi:hypothetical protein
VKNGNILKTTKFFFGEITKIFGGLIFLLFNFLLIGLWRLYDVKTFLFLQIVITHSLSLLICYLFSALRKPKWKGQELLMFFMSLFLVSVMLLNIDRSRSVFLLKWAHEAGAVGIKSSALAEESSLKSDNKQDYLLRINEQVQSKNLKIENNYVKISTQGKFLINLFRLIAKVERLNGFKTA